MLQKTFLTYVLIYNMQTKGLVSYSGVATGALRPVLPTRRSPSAFMLLAKFLCTETKNPSGVQLLFGCLIIYKWRLEKIFLRRSLVCTMGTPD